MYICGVTSLNISYGTCWYGLYHNKIPLQYKSVIAIDSIEVKSVLIEVMGFVKSKVCFGSLV